MFHAISELVQAAETAQKPLAQIVLEAEMAQSGRSALQIRRQMHRRLAVMRASATQGIQHPIRSLSGMTDGNAHRFAGWLKLPQTQALTGSVLSRAVARALSIGEVNAGMGCIVATPTAGSAGILPAVLLTLQETHQFDDEQLVDALFTAGGVGAVIVHRAHVSGAAGGCQAETGSAAAMAAAAAVELLGGTPQQSAHALAITLTNMLGLVCDPIAGLVEFPCIQRNAAGVAQCFLAVDLALAGIECIIPADEVIDAMEHVGQRMDERFRETAQGGLAATPTGRELAQSIWKQKQIGEEKA